MDKLIDMPIIQTIQCRFSKPKQLELSCPETEMAENISDVPAELGQVHQGRLDGGYSDSYFQEIKGC